MACNACVDELTVSVGEGDSGSVVMTLRDENGDLVEKAAINSILLTLYRRVNTTNEVINDRDAQGVLDVNGGEYFDTIQTATDTEGNEVTYNFRWDYEPADTPFLKSDSSPEQTEVHLALFRFTWNGGASARSILVRMAVTNYHMFEVA